MQSKFFVWLLFIILSFIWGSSFILMKIGLDNLSAYQVASLRILSAGVILLPFGWTAWKKIPREKKGYVFLSGLIGSFFPAFLFCLAETYIDSSLAGIINALTPLFTIMLGVIFFDLQLKKNVVVGVVIGFTGLCLLPFVGTQPVSFQYIYYSSFALIATVFYGVNVNLVGRHLKTVNALSVASLAFIFLIPASLIILFFTGFFNLPGYKILSASTLASCVLGVAGTALATILFYMLVKRAGSVIASLVTYAIPVVAILWGFLRKEWITPWQAGCLIIILGGVYMVNKKTSPR
ncbi:MAG: family transporter [Chitinophagaceae bacterium]|nr:family transporter [Chitinophagaceae bacterium]